MSAEKKVLLDIESCRSLRRFFEPLTAFHADAAAHWYENRGQVEQALAEWSVSARFKHEGIDSRICQALLKSVNATDEERLRAQLEWADRHAISLHDANAVRFRPYDGERRITIGYVCAWWDSSTIRGQAIPFISRHDRRKFRLIGYSLDKCGASITQYFDDFKVIKPLSHEQFARLVRADEVDILVELTGFSPFHRHAAMGARCAPVQISYLNHAGTTGVSNVDYVVADEISCPPELEEFYSEEILRLPGTFFNFNYDWDAFPDAGPPPCLERGTVTFGCFGSQSKINDAQIYMWARLLLALPGTRLLLRNRGLEAPEHRSFMARRFRQWGVEDGRVMLKPGGERYSILQDYSQIDISLDTWPYNGGNTIAESLWQGVPVITLKGGSFPSAYGASLLEASGCADLVAQDLDDQIRIARALAADKPRLGKLRRELRGMMKAHGFADSERFCRTWEQALAAALKRAAPAGAMQ
jgi:predicted O-linked N-acetylglucosamine transferase (SPINDLY family)